jgi:hypothetical protein
MLRTLPSSLSTAVLLALAACSGDAPPEAVLATPAEALHKAEDVNQLIDDAAARQRQAIDEQGR